MNAMWLVVLALVGCELSDKDTNLAPVLVESQPNEGTELPNNIEMVSVFAIVSDTDASDLDEEWFLVTGNTERTLEAPHDAQALPSANGQETAFFLSFTPEQDEGTTLRLVVTDLEGASLVVDWPLAAAE